MIDWPVFRSGAPMSAAQMNKLVRSCRQLERMIRANRLQPGVGYMLNQGSGGVSVAIRKSKAVAGGETRLPFAVSVRSETNKSSGKVTYFAVVSRNGGVIADVMGKPYQVSWTDEAIEYPIPNDGVGLFAVTLDWEYEMAYTKTDHRVAQMSVVKVVESQDEPEALKPVITPITGNDPDTKVGNSRVVLAVLEGKLVDGKVDIKLTQYVQTSLRAYWLPGYVDEVAGSIGQYADVSVGYYSK